MSTAPHAPPAADSAFADLLSEVADAIESSVPTWRLRLGEAAARWQAEGVETTILERALRLTDAPDVDGLLATFAAAVARLRALHREAVALDAARAGDAPFRDPARVGDATAIVAELRAAAGARAPVAVDPECWVHHWPDVASLLIEEDA